MIIFCFCSSNNSVWEDADNFLISSSICSSNDFFREDTSNLLFSFICSSNIVVRDDVDNSSRFLARTSNLRISSKRVISSTYLVLPISSEIAQTGNANFVFHALLRVRCYRCEEKKDSYFWRYYECFKLKIISIDLSTLQDGQAYRGVDRTCLHRVWRLV